MKDSPPIVLHIEVSEALYLRLSRASARTGKPLAKVVREAIAAHLRDHRKGDD